MAYPLKASAESVFLLSNFCVELAFSQFVQVPSSQFPYLLAPFFMGALWKLVLFFPAFSI